MNRHEFEICPICFAFIPSDLGAVGLPTGTNYRQAHYNWHAQQVVHPVQQLSGTFGEKMPEPARIWC